MKRTQLFKESHCHLSCQPSDQRLTYWQKARQIEDKDVGKAIADYMKFVGEEMKQATFLKLV